MLEKVFVVTPAYNAERTLEGVYQRFPEAARERITRYVAVDDGSTDRTHEVLQELAREEPKLTVLRHEENRGYGAAQKTLLNHALEEGADMAIGVHADGQIVFVLMDNREDFAEISAEVRDHRPGKALLTKTVEKGGLFVIFQHWIRTGDGE